MASWWGNQPFRKESFEGGGALGNLLGWNGNAFYDAFNKHRGAIGGLGLGLAEGGKEFMPAAAAGALQGNQVDLEELARQKKMSDDQEHLAKAAQGLISMGRQDLANAVKSGGFSPDSAFSLAFQKAPLPDSYTLGPGDRRYQGSELIAEGAPAAPEIPKIQQDIDARKAAGASMGLTGDALTNYSLTGKVPGAGDLSAAETKELFQTEDTIQAANSVVSALDRALELNPQTRSGWGADVGAQVGANVPDWVPVFGGNEGLDNNTMELKNIVTEQALNQLKLTFGGNPTEGERQILLDIQGSVNQPPEVRKRIYERAKDLALKRLKFNEDRKVKLETGGYGTINPQGQQPAPGGNVTSTGVTWSF